MTYRVPPSRAVVRHGRVPRFGALQLLLCCACAWALSVHAAPKTDVIVFINGDRLTGEVKSLEHGRLEFKTDAAGTIDIEWNKISTVETTQVLQVETADGLRYLGRAPEAAEAGRLALATRAVKEEDKVSLPMMEIVRIAPIDQGDVFARLDGYVTAGFDYTKANDLTQFNFTGGLRARTEKRQWQIDGSSTMTSQQGSDDSNRFDATGAYRHFMPDRWFVQGFVGLEGNDELGLDLRSTVGAAYGRYLQQTNQREWAAYAGLAVTAEDFGGDESRDSVEGIIGTQYSYYRYDSPEASIDFSVNLLPSVTEAGRLRSEAKLRSRYEIVTDLFFEASLYGSYDSDPGEEALSKSDYGVVTSLGYSF